MIEPGYCQCGCGEWAGVRPHTDKSRGWVKGEPKRFIRGHNMSLNGDFERRFWGKVEKGAGDECWPWSAGLTNKGYGAFYFDGRNRPAHRIAYEMLVGPIPDGLVLDHLCRNRSCVNPAHLEPVTPKENVLRGVGITAANARKTRCPQGHPYDEVNAGFTEAGGRYCRECHRLRTAQARMARKAAA